MKTQVLIILIILFAVAVRFYKLTEIPGEWFGDISNVHEYVTEIFEGKWPFYFLQSPGPFYHYLIIPLVLLFKNLGYETYKYSSAIISILGLIGAYLFAREIAGRKVALITVLVSSFSLWGLIWSRLGNSQIVIPAYISFSVFYFLRFIKLRKDVDLIITVLITSTGWYIYPQTFVWPPFVFLCLLIFIISNQEKKLLWNRILTFSVMVIIGILPFMLIIKNQNKYFAGNFSSDGYLGEKIFPVFSMKPGELFGKLGYNLSKTYLMLHVSGDSTFRVNIAGSPQLDSVSGILFILGIFYIFRKVNVWLGVFVIMSLLILPLPSVTPAVPVSEIPSNSRTIAIIPFVYFLTASGIFVLFEVFKKVNRIAAIVICVLVIVSITKVNLGNYFIYYARGLPGKNLGPSRLIAGFVDRNFPESVKLYFAACCWGEAGEPEPKAIAYSLRKTGRKVDYSHLVDSCDEIERPSIIIVRDEDRLSQELINCLGKAARFSIISKEGKYVSGIIFAK